MTLDALTPLLRCPACGATLSLDRVPQPDPDPGDCGVLRCPWTQRADRALTRVVRRVRG